MAKLKSATATFRDAGKRKRFLALETLSRKHPCMHARMWFLQSDTKRGATVKFDKSGQALLLLLRHLKRVSEVRPQHGWYLDMHATHACVRARASAVVRIIDVRPNGCRV